MVRKYSARPAAAKSVETLFHDEAKRRNIPTAEYESLLQEEGENPLRVAFERRNRDLDPQLVWRGKDEQDWSDLVVQAPPLYIQEKVHPKVLIDDLLRRPAQLDLFAYFNGIFEGADKTDFYQHDQNWSNRMILGDSLQVMANLAEREGLRGKVQCIYVDPPYGIKFNSNFQWSTTSRDVRDGNPDHITREPEQVKAFRDTWRDGIHSYLTYLRDRLTVARDLLTDSGSIFVQIGDENLHLARCVMDQVFGADNCCGIIIYQKTTFASSTLLPILNDYLLWYSRGASSVKYRQLFTDVDTEQLAVRFRYVAVGGLQGPKRGMSKSETIERLPAGSQRFMSDNITSPGGSSLDSSFDYLGKRYLPGGNLHWKTDLNGMQQLARAGRLFGAQNSLRYVRLPDDFGVSPMKNLWTDTTAGSFQADKVFVVQTSPKVVERCILMTTDPGDLVLDPTCGSGTTAHVAEQWGRRWITIDTSRVALALARARIMGARYPYYLLADSREGQQKEAEVTRTGPSSHPVHGDLRQGFVYERVPHIQLGDIARNSEIDVIWETWQATLEPLRAELNATLDEQWQEWEIPREANADWPEAGEKLHADWWKAQIARQKEIDASVAAKAEFEYLYDKPYTDNKKVRVAGPFTVESLSPHRVLGVDEDGELIDRIAEHGPDYHSAQSFAEIILENLTTAGVQQAHKDDRITFTSLTPWPGRFVCAEGRYVESEGGAEKRAGILIGPEFGTVTRPDLVEAAREAADAGFDVLVACAFNYEAHATEFNKLGRIPVLKARMNADLHMAGELKNTGKGNLFVVFGEPDITILPAENDQIRVKVNGVDVFHPSTGEVRSDGADGIACWFVDTDYNQESFFVRQAYFLGANDPYSALKTTLKAEIDEEAWDSLHSETSRPFDKPPGGRIAVKVINILGDEVMKVFRIA